MRVCVPVSGVSSLSVCPVCVRPVDCFTAYTNIVHDEDLTHGARTMSYDISICDSQTVCIQRGHEHTHRELIDSHILISYDITSICESY